MPRVKLTIRQRLERRREVRSDGCWLWTGTRTNAGYGSMTIQTDAGPKSRLVHRVSYETYVGAIPDGRHLDHLCRNRLCHNPAHLEPVTPRTNLMRSAIAPAAINAAKTHCPQGHPYDEVNTYITPSNGGRLCRACHKARQTRKASA